MPATLLRYFCALLAAALTYAASAQIRSGPTQPQPLRKASQLIQRQEPIKINHSLMTQATPDSVHVVISLPKQRAYLMIGEQIVIDSPISSGKRGHTSPTGHLPVLEKDPNHHSSLYGDFVGATMKWFMRLTGDGVGMHVGILPGYPASHGCIRMPFDGAKLFYDRVKVGTPVEVQPAS